MKYLYVIFSSLFISNIAIAEDTNIDMLNKLDGRTMLFSKEIVRIDAGDTVFLEINRCRS